MARTRWETEDSKADSTEARREREHDRARRQNRIKSPRPQGARVHARQVRGGTGKVSKMRSMLWRGIPKARAVRPAVAKELSRRSFARVRYIPNKGPGHWSAHGRYLEREGAQKEGEKGLGFGSAGQDVSVSQTLDAWQTSGDDRLWKVVLSPEDGDRLDLRDFTRRTMAGFERSLGFAPGELEWAAIDHYNTQSPHVHIVIRGSKNLEISPPQIQGMRHISEDIATQTLGYRTQRDVHRQREKEIAQDRFTGLDREIERQATVLPDQRQAVTIDNTGPSFRERMHMQKDARALADDKARQRTQVIARLQHLETLGLAEKAGSMSWTLDAGWQKGLKELGIMRTRSTMLIQHRELMSDKRILPTITKLQPGDRLTGRVLGTGLDEDTDKAYLLIEGTDGRAHFVYQNAKIEGKRHEGELRPGTLATLEQKSFEKDGKTIAYLAITDHGLTIPASKTPPIPAEILDAEIAHAVRKTGSPPMPDEHSFGFAQDFRQQVARRLADPEVRKAVQVQQVQPLPDAPAMQKKKKEKARGKGAELG